MNFTHGGAEILISCNEKRILTYIQTIVVQILIYTQCKLPARMSIPGANTTALRASFVRNTPFEWITY